MNEIWYPTDDGLKLYAKDYPARQTDAQHTVLCMHGLTRNSADFDHLAINLSDYARVISVDQRGRGNSEWDQNSSHYEIPRYVQDMFTLIDHLQLKNIILLGTSMGGIMSMMMVALKPDLFSAVILNDVGPVVGSKGLARIKSYVGTSAPAANLDEAISQTAAANSVAFPDYTKQDWARWVDRMYRENDAGQLALRYDPEISTQLNKDDSTAVTADPWPVFEPLTHKPLMTIRGELSDILEPDCVDEMKRRHPGMKLLQVSRVGHAPMLDEPGVAEAISVFIRNDV